MLIPGLPSCWYVLPPLGPATVLEPRAIEVGWRVSWRKWLMAICEEGKSEVYEDDHPCCSPENFLTNQCWCLKDASNPRLNSGPGFCLGSHERQPRLNLDISTSPLRPLEPFRNPPQDLCPKHSICQCNGLATSCYHRRQVSSPCATISARPAAALFACFKVGARLELQSKNILNVIIAEN